MTTALLDPPAPQIDDDGTRREFIAGGVALSLGLAACGGDDQPAAGPQRRSIKTPLGPVEVPAQARRVVALDQIQGIAHDLGAPLVARGQNVEPWKRDDGAYRELPVADEEFIADVEAIAQLRPDLILGQAYAIEPVREQLRRLAAVVEIPDGFQSQWRQLHLLVAEACGLPSPAPLLERVAQRARAIGPQLPASIESAAIVRAVEAGQFRVYKEESFSGQLVDDAGLDVLDLGDDGSGLIELSLERLGEVRSDVIFLWATGADAAVAAADPSIVTDTSLWSRLPAVRGGRVVEVGAHWIGFDSEAAGLVLSDVERLA